MKTIYVLIGVILPFLLTSLGSSFVFILKNNLNNKIKKLLIGLSIGVMLSSSIFSLLIPSIEVSKIKWFTPSIGIILGFIFLILINKLTIKNINMTMFSVTLHNIPEGMVVGSIFAAYIYGINEVTLIDAFMVSLGIAIQNIPEGSIISIPYRIQGYSKMKSFVEKGLNLKSGKGFLRQQPSGRTFLADPHLIQYPYCIDIASDSCENC